MQWVGNHINDGLRSRLTCSGVSAVREDHALAFGPGARCFSDADKRSFVSNDSDLSVWLSVDRFSDVYPFLSPYHYCVNNPINITDISGDILDVTTEDGQSDITNMANEENRKYISFEKVGDVYRTKLDFGDMSDADRNKILESDKGLSLVNDLVNATVSETKEDGSTTTRDAKFLYNTNSAYTSESNVKEIDNSSNDPVKPIRNLSTTHRYNGWDYESKRPRGEQPEAGYDGAVTISKGSFINTITGQNVRTSIKYHELMENYGRTILKMPYMNPDGAGGAHGYSVNREGSWYGNDSSGNVDNVLFL